MKNNNKGFSLIELIVVLGIMAVLAGVIIGSTGAVGNRRLKKCATLLDGAMKKARVDAMAKSDTSGVRVYLKDGRYYADIVGKQTDSEGNEQYAVVETVELERGGDIRMTLSNPARTDEETLTDGDENSYILIEYAHGTGAITSIRTGSDSFERTDRTRIYLERENRNRKGDLKCIEIVPATGKHTLI